MADATQARDAARTALDRKHDLVVLLEDALIILNGEVASPSSPDSAAFISCAQSLLHAAGIACDAVHDAIGAAQAEVTKLARQVPVAADSPLRCHVHLIHADKSEDRCVLAQDHLTDDLPHVDSHGHRAPVLISQSTLDEVRAWQDVPWPWERENGND
jgi:hypothetical protein